MPFIGYSDDRNFRYQRMREKAIFDFERVDVLPTADDEVLDATSDLDVSERINRGFVTRLSRPQY